MSIETATDVEKPLLDVTNLVVEYRLKGGRTLRAVADVSLQISRGETLGVLGESGCGKSTLARAIVQLPAPAGGSVVFEGRELTGLSHRELRPVRPRIQLIYQDPVSSLNPLRRVKSLVLEGLVMSGTRLSREERRKIASSLLEDVGLDYERFADRRPHELSGGQCQRVSIARALATKPDLLICDEPVSALDVLIQAQILNLLEDLKKEHGLTVLFIAHDLGVVKAVSDRIAVMYLGRLCEIGNSDDVYERPLHPYTLGLLAAVPRVEASAEADSSTEISGDIPSPLAPPSGCRFRTRCPFAAERCAAEVPELREVQPDHFVACHFPLSQTK